MPESFRGANELDFKPVRLVGLDDGAEIPGRKPCSGRSRSKTTVSSAANTLSFSRIRGDQPWGVVSRSNHPNRDYRTSRTVYLLGYAPDPAAYRRSRFSRGGPPAAAFVGDDFVQGAHDAAWAVVEACM